MSGGGLLLYWLLSMALATTPTELESIEQLVEASETALAEGTPGQAAAEAEAAWAALQQADDAPAGLVAWVALALSDAGRQAGRLEGREDALLQALKAVQAPGADAHPSYVSALYESLAVWRLEDGDLDAAAANAVAALRERAASEGEGAPGQAITLNLLAGIRLQQGDPTAALAMAEAALSVVEEDDTGTFGPLDRAQALAGIAYMEQNAGSLPRAIERAEEALRILEAHLPPDHRALAAPLNNLGVMYRQQGRFAEGVQLLERALTIREGIEGINPLELSITRANLANELVEDGRFAEAIAIYRQAISDVEASYGQDNPAVFSLRLSLGNTLTLSDALVEGLEVLEDTVPRAAAVLGDAHPTVAYGELLLASILEEIGDSGRSRVLADAAQRSLRDGLATEHPDHALALGQLASLAMQRGELAEAIGTARAAAMHVEATAGRNRQWQYYQMLEVQLLLRLGHDDEALTRIRELRPLVELHKQLGLDLQEAEVRLTRGDLSGAEALIPPLQGLSAPRLRITTLGLMAQLAWSRGEPEQALASLEQALTESERFQLHLAGHLSLRQRSEQRLAARSHLDAFLTLASPTAAFDAVQRWKQAALHDLSATSGGGTPEQRQLQTARLDLLRRIAAWEQREATPEIRDAALLALGEQLDEVERGLVHRSGLAPAAPNAADICATLADDEALVELVRYAPWSGDGRDQPWQVDALVLRGGDDCAARRVGLGAADTLEQLASDYLSQVQAGLGEGALRRRGARLRRQLWDPVAGLTSDARHIWWVPEDIVASVPLAPLPLEDGSLWIEHRSVASLTSSVELVLPRSPGPGRGALVVGEVDFGPGDTWTPLPGTAVERDAVATALRRRLRRVTELTGAAATEPAVVSSAARARVVHLATHGWYATPAALTQARSEVRSARLVHTFAGDLPVALAGRSGLAMAGANDPGEDPSRDGRWIEAEVAAVDLSGAQLVTLSACETGLGVSRRGEGVLGLGQALLAAGARSSLLTLWQVPDTETATMMAQFYDGLTRRRGRPPADALRQAQLARIKAQRQQTGESLPWTWAAFQVSGRGARERLSRQ